jgi:flagellar motor protein MotB
VKIMSDNIGLAVAGEETAPVAAMMRSLLDQLMLARAAELARAGHYLEAEKILSAAGDEKEYAPPVLDLLARVRAQQGHLAEAEQLWTRASRLDPLNNAYQMALRRAAALQQRPLRLRLALPLAACLVFGAVVYFWWQQRQNAQQSQTASTQQAQQQQAQPQNSQSQVISTPVQPDSALRPTDAGGSAVQTAAAVSPVENSINVPGVTQTKTAGVLHLSFDDGLFARGLILKPDARARLRQLGEQLKPYAATSAVEIVGMTDDLPLRRDSLYPDNASLGIDRARIVYDFLRRTSGLEAQLFTIGGSGEQQTPHPNDTPANRARNRTVVLRISTRQR